MGVMLKDTMDVDERVLLFKSYFRGREDVYPKFYTDKYGKIGYKNACYNEGKQGVCINLVKGKCKDCTNRCNLTLSDDAIKMHMYHGETIGIYPILKDDTCYFLSFDFDNKKNNFDIKTDVISFYNTCEKYDLPIILERSRSGNGIHIWLFFEDKIKAKDARKLGNLLLTKTYEDIGFINTFDRMFPNQDYIPENGYGNLIALPFQTIPGKAGNTVFVDKNFNQIEDQIKCLKETRKLSVKEVYEKINILSNELSFSQLNSITTIKNKKYVNNIIYPKDINIILKDMIYINKENLSDKIIKCLKKLVTFTNKDFYKKQSMNINTYNTKRVFNCSRENDKYLILPIGAYDKLLLFCNENNIKINKDDKRFCGRQIDVEFNGKLDEEQELALSGILSYDTGILNAPTAFGKTVIACKLIALKNINTLILTDRLQILAQWKEKIHNFLGIDAGEINGDKRNITNIIDIASVASVSKDSKVDEIVNNYGMIIVDECQHAASVTYSKILNNASSKFIYGFSATPDRTDGKTPIEKMNIGDVRYDVSKKIFNESLRFKMLINVRHTKLNDIEAKEYKLNGIYEVMTNDNIRNKQIIDDIYREFEKKKNILVLTKRIKHLEVLKEDIKKITDNLFIYCGGINKKTKEMYKRMNAEIIKNNENKIILATTSCIGEGFDDISLDVLFLAMPISNDNIVTQCVGRLHRKCINKKEIIVYDYVDNIKLTENMYRKREKTYKKLGYQIISNDGYYQDKFIFE